jgi:tripartite-type tricarboxylate transporter receptor subunit TctC
MAILGRLSFAVIAAIGALAAHAQPAYPDKPVKFVVPVASGGVTDVVARVLAARLTVSLGQAVIVENRAGGSGIPAADYVAHSKPDGYILFMGTIGTLTVNQAMFASMPYDPARDFTPVSLVAGAPTILVVTPGLPVHSVRDLVAYAKANPGKLNYASFGNGTSSHLAGELFKSLAGVSATHVPYKGAGPALTDLLAGRVDLLFDNIITSLPHIKDGRLRALAVTAAQRSRLVPDVPTMAEAGLPGQEISGWLGLVAPAGTPSEIVEKLSAQMARQLRLPEVQEKLVGVEAVGSTPAEFDAFMRSERAKWTRLVKEAGIRAD